MGFFVLLLGAGAVALIWVLHNGSVKKAASAATWPTVQGSVSNSGVNERMIQSKNGRRRSYTPHVTYQYVVNGQTYSSDDVSTGFTNSYQFEQHARQIADRHPTGSAVTVYYDPQNPAKAVLEVKKPGKTIPIILTVVAVFMTLILSAVFSAAGAVAS